MTDATKLINESNHDMKRLQFRSELIVKIDAMTAVQMANLIAYIDAQPFRSKIESKQ